MSLHFKVLLTLAGVLIYWFSLWDLCWNLPREAVIEATYESRDDGVEDAEAYSRRHVSPRVEVYLMLIGVLYCLVSALVLILTGGLYSFINKDTEETHTVITISLSRPDDLLPPRHPPSLSLSGPSPNLDSLRDRSPGVGPSLGL
jgi:hypothetical protein